jgi:hypothetical protein
MPKVDTGDVIIAQRLVGTGVPAIDGTNGYIGVGDSSTAHADGQTDLQAATNKFRQVLDGAPTGGAAELTLVATFPTGDANFAWEEWGVFNHASGTTTNMLSRKVESLGTKTSAQTWVATVTLTVT